MKTKNLITWCTGGIVGVLIVVGLKQLHDYQTLSFPEHIQRGHRSAVARYLKAGNDIEARDAEGRTLLLQSIIAKQPKLTQFLLQQGALPDAVDAHGISAIGTALKYHQYQTATCLASALSLFSDSDKIALLLSERFDLAQQFIADHPLTRDDQRVFNYVFNQALRRSLFERAHWLIGLGIDLTTPGAVGPKAFMSAARDNQPDRAKFLIHEGVPIDIKGGPYEQTALILAADEDAPEMVAFLLEQGADPLLTDNCGLSAIDQAARQNHYECAKILVTYGVPINDSTCSPLVLACLYGEDTRLVDLLLANGADVEQTDDYGHTALLAAMRSGNLAKAKRLLAHGADANKENDEGENIAMLAIRSGNPQLLSFIIQQTNVDINHRNSNNRSLLTHAASFGNFSTVAWLIDHGARVPDALDDEGVNATLYAAVVGQVKLMQLLDQHEANLNILSPVYGRTPLMIAAENGHLELVNYLITAGACLDIRATTGQHETALELAQKADHREIVERLKMADHP